MCAEVRNAEVHIDRVAQHSRSVRRGFASRRDEQAITGSDALELRVVLEPAGRRHEGVGDVRRQLADALSVRLAQRQLLEVTAARNAQEQRPGDLAARFCVVHALGEAVHVVRELHRFSR